MEHLLEDDMGCAGIKFWENNGDYTASPQEAKLD